jgi:hydroxymethylbilane synthase
VRLRVGTRGSALALAQANYVARRLTAAGHEPEIVQISTTGDQVTDRSFTDVGAFGVFVRELESALLTGAIDVAVHSYKDLPSRGSDELTIGAVPERVDPADVLLVRHAHGVPERGGLPLAEGASVGTSAMRRRALLHEARPDLRVGLLRGNVPTRVRALAEGRFDAIVLAAAGLTRLARVDGPGRLTLPAGITIVRLDPSVFVPAPSQGAIAIQVRRDDCAVSDAVAPLDDATCRRTLHAERAALAHAEGGCTLPFGAWCTADAEGRLMLTTALGHDDGTVTRGTFTGTDPDDVAAGAWRGVSRYAVR